MRLIRLLLLLGWGLVPVHVSAETATDRQELNPWVAVLVFEGVVAINASLAAEDPHAYGAAAMLLFPVGAMQTPDKTLRWASLIGAEALALYNLTLDENKHSKNELFRNNVIGWHMFAALLGITDLAFRGRQSERFNLAFGPVADGAAMNFSYRF